MHNATGRCYVGRDSNYPRRNNQHVAGTSGSPRICNAIKKYGVNAFTFAVVQALPNTLTQTEIKDCEEYWIEYFEAFTEGFNLTPTSLGAASDEDNPMKRPEILEKITGKNHYLYGVTGEKHPLYGKSRPDLAEYNRRRDQSGENHPNYRKPNPKFADYLRQLTGEDNPNTLENRQKRAGIKQLKLFED